jgi:hypothetical protein
MMQGIQIPQLQPARLPEVLSLFGWSPNLRQRAHVRHGSHRHSQHSDGECAYFGVSARLQSLSSTGGFGDIPVIISLL